VAQELFTHGQVTEGLDSSASITKDIFVPDILNAVPGTRSGPENIEYRRTLLTSPSGGISSH
jgi:hypothetical protein